VIFVIEIIVNLIHLVTMLTIVDTFECYTARRPNTCSECAIVHATLSHTSLTRLKDRDASCEVVVPPPAGLIVPHIL